MGECESSVSVAVIQNIHDTKKADEGLHLCHISYDLRCSQEVSLTSLLFLGRW